MSHHDGIGILKISGELITHFGESGLVGEVFLLDLEINGFAELERKTTERIDPIIPFENDIENFSCDSIGNIITDTINSKYQ